MLDNQLWLELFQDKIDNKQDSSYLKQIFDHIQDGILVMDQERSILLMNPSAERMTGWKVGGKVPYCSYCQNRAVQLGEERCYLLAKREVPYFLSSMPTYEGRYIDMEMSTAVIHENKDKNHHEVLLVLKDLTSKNKEEEARISKLCLQKTLEAQENEHKRLAQELHDGVGQSLYSVSVGLQAIQARINEDERFKEYMKEIVDELGKVIQDVKFYSLQLRPHSLDKLGLIPTITYLVNSLDRAHPETQITFECNTAIENVRLSPMVEINLYRVVQEAIHNALKYASASYIKVYLVLHDNNLITLRICDDGKGFVHENVKEGLGMKHMQERVEQLNGVIQINSTLGEGTRLMLQIPCERNVDI